MANLLASARGCRVSLLNAEQLRSFEERGYLALESVYEEGAVEELRAALEELRGDDAALVGPDGRVYRHAVTGGEGERIPLLRLMSRVHETFRRHAFNPSVTQAAAELLRTDLLRLITDQAAIKDPNTSGAVHWHQDYSYWHFRPATQITCWLALDDVSVASGAVCYVPGSHRLGEFAPVDVGTGRRNAADPRPCVPDDPASEGHEVVSVELPAGGCVFHHSLTWHASPPNVSPRPRRAVLTRYMARGTTFSPRGIGLRPASPEARLVPGQEIEWDEEFPIAWRALT
jgi:phytanoyl-CoA hydroxylase